MEGRGEDGWGRSDRPREDLERDIDDEIAFHEAMRTRDAEARGLSPQEARADARRRLGDLDEVRREMRRVGRARIRARARKELPGDLLRDLRLATRTLRRRPLFTTMAALTLALGIGASTAVFSVANQVLLRAVPGVAAPDSLVAVTVATEGAPDAAFVFSHRDYLELRRGAPAFAALAASQGIDANVWLPGTDAPRRMPVAYVSDDFSEALGLRALAGRLLTPADALEPAVTVISEHLWASLFDRAPAAVGSTLSLNGTPFTVIGVAPKGFRGTSLLGDTELWVPVEAHRAVIPQAGMDVLAESSYPVWMELVGRLRPGASATRAADQLRAVLARFDAEGGHTLPHRAMPRVRQGIGLSPWERSQLVSALRVLGAGVALLLLLACANAANLLLARAGGRAEELAIRRAIGAGRGRLLRLLLSEAAIVVLLAAAAGLALAAGAVDLLRGARLLTFMPPMEGIAIDGHVLLFTLGASVFTGLAFGVAPSLLASADRRGVLRSGRRSLRRGGPSHLLVVAQVAMSTVLLVGSGLLLKTVHALGLADLGFEPLGTLEASIDPGAQGYDEARREAFFRDLLGGTRALPGVRSAGLSWIPVQGRGRGSDLLRPEGLDADDPHAVTAGTNQVSPGFSAAIGLELIAGRDFRPEEMFASGGDVVIVSETAARRMFPDGGAVGRRIDAGWQRPRTLEIVGVVRDARITTLKEPGGALFFEPLGQPWIPDHATLYVRGRGGATPAPGDLTRLLREMDPGLPFYDMQPLTRRVVAGATMERVLARLTSAFAGLALLLVTVGLYATLAMLVQGRRREMGVRLALGARPQQVRGWVVRRGMRLAGLGVVVGLLASTRATALLSARLWEVGPRDPVVFGVAVVAVLLATLLACWEPAARATRVDPVDALAGE